MCTMSAIVRTVEDQFYDRYPSVIYPIQPEVSREEFEILQNQVKELVKLLKVAKEYDKTTGQTDCEDADKVEFLKQLAKWLDVDIEDLF